MARLKVNPRKSTGGINPQHALVTYTPRGMTAPARGGVKVPTATSYGSRSGSPPSSASSSHSSADEWSARIDDMVKKICNLEEGVERNAMVRGFMEEYVQNMLAKQKKELEQDFDEKVETRANELLEEKFAGVKEVLLDFLKKEMQISKYREETLDVIVSLVENKD